MKAILYYTYKTVTPIRTILKLNNIDVATVDNTTNIKTALNKHDYQMCIIHGNNPEDVSNLVSAARSISEQMFIIAICDNQFENVHSSASTVRIAQTETSIAHTIELGADDYFYYPYNINYVVAIIKARLRRSHMHKMKDVYAISEYTLDVQGHTLVHASGATIKLSHKETCLIQLLFHFANTTLQRQLILKTVWHEDSYYTSRSLDVFMVRIKKYLSLDPNISIITERGYGYCLSV